MSQSTLFQVWVPDPLATRIKKIVATHGIPSAELQRRALSEIADRLEALPAPFPHAEQEDATP